MFVSGRFKLSKYYEVALILGMVRDFFYHPKAGPRLFRLPPPVPEICLVTPREGEEGGGVGLATGLELDPPPLGGERPQIFRVILHIKMIYTIATVVPF